MRVCNTMFLIILVVYIGASSKLPGKHHIKQNGSSNCKSGQFSDLFIQTHNNQIDLIIWTYFRNEIWRLNLQLGYQWRHRIWQTWDRMWLWIPARRTVCLSPPEEFRRNGLASPEITAGGFHWLALNQSIGPIYTPAPEINNPTTSWINSIVNRQT